MTKEELIELSDLNREDNIKYISSEAQGIAIALDSDRYAPTLCKLERAYICGRRKSEAQIEKMKCCGNCKKLKCRFDSKTNINILYCSDSDMKQIEVGFQMCCCKWEIKEK